MAEEPTLVRKKRKRSKYPPHWVIIPVLVLVAAWLGWRRFGPVPETGPFVLPGYITSAAVFEQESARFYGKVAQQVDAAEKFQLAADSMSKRDFGGAAALLEEASKQTAIPVIFNDLGVLYARMEDPARTVNAFREALARDEGYGPARKNLERLKGMHLANTAYPVTREIEPNDRFALANLVSLGKPVDGEISGNGGDVDWYRVNAPVPPRDLIQIEITSRSNILELILSAFDDSMAALGPSKKSPGPGASVTGSISALPNSTVYVKIEGIGGSTGPYTVVVRALKAFDAYEPNDDIYSSPKLAIGQTIEASIMDERDTDYFSFVGPRTGQVQIELENRSTTLIPALSTYSPDRRFAGFGPEVRTAGTGLKHSMAVDEGRTYFLQVWPQGNSRGAYRLTVR
jgi:hypothetical protein